MDYKFGFQTIAEVCQFFDIPDFNCSCKLFNVTTRRGNVDFCLYSKLDGEQNSMASKLLAAFTAVANTAGILGNVLVVLVLWGNQKLASRHTQLIMLLAISDLFFASLSFIDNVQKFVTDRWLYGLVGCKIISSGLSLGALVAIGMILIIAIERFMVTVYPFKIGLSSNATAYSLIIGNVFLAACAVIPRLFVLTVDSGDCKEVWGKRVHAAIYSWLILIIYFIIPVATISILYAKIFKALNKSFRQTFGTSCTQTIEAYSARLKSNRKTMTMLVAVLVAFVVFTFPNKLRWVIFDTHSLFYKRRLRSYDFYLIAEIMYPFHVSINPMIYAIGSKVFRQELLKKFGRKRKVNP